MPAATFSHSHATCTPLTRANSAPARWPHTDSRLALGPVWVYSLNSKLGPRDKEVFPLPLLIIPSHPFPLIAFERTARILVSFPPLKMITQQTEKINYLLPGDLTNNILNISSGKKRLKEIWPIIKLLYTGCDF